MSSDTILHLQNITKRFGGVIALNDANFSLERGEIHVLIGENGAGKSTLIKVITGVHQVESGDIYLNGNKTVFHDPKDALDSGIVAIYQNVTSYPNLTVTENIFIGHEEVSPKTKRILWKKMHQKAQAFLDELGANFSSRDIVCKLSVAQQQIVEIAKALSTNAKIIIMDEPTASLTTSETEDLYKITKKIKREGGSIIFVSHKFEDVYSLADRVTVFRDAKYINTWNIKDVNKEALTYAMVGREIKQLYRDNRRKVEKGDVALKVEHISSIGIFKDISFEIKYGEILGFTGLIGSGRTEVFQSILGIEPMSSGNVYIDGKQVVITHPSDAYKLGLGYLPEDRHLQGTFLSLSLTQNVTISCLDLVSRYMCIDHLKEKELTQMVTEQLEVKASSTEAKISSLSGGNQQKIILCKILAKNSKIIILDEPTKGVDIGAKSAIYKIMSDFVAHGYAIAMISSEMPEILGMSDRVVVMRKGRISELLDNNNIDQEMLLKASLAD